MDKAGDFVRKGSQARGQQGQGAQEDWVPCDLQSRVLW